MKLGIRMLNTDATLNRFQAQKNIKINQGETVNMVFQLTDASQGIRFVPTSAAIAFVEIARYPDWLASPGNQRVQVDYSIRRNAAMLFPTDDRSIWYMPLTTADTANMMSTNIRVTIVDGANTYIALLSQAIVVTRSENDPAPISPDVPNGGL